MTAANVYQQRPTSGAKAESSLHHADLASLVGKGRKNAGVTVREKKLLGHLTIRGDGHDAAFAAGPEAEPLSVVLQSEQLIPARPSGRQPATITVSCAAEVLNVAFAFAGNTMSALGNDAGITLQNDLQAARSRTLPVNADNTAVLLNNSRDSLAFLQGLEGVTNLTVRVTPVNSRSLSVRYRVDSFVGEIAPVVEACGG